MAWLSPSVHGVAHLGICVLMRHHRVVLHMPAAGATAVRHPAVPSLHHVLAVVLVHRRVVHVGVVPHLGVVHDCCNDSRSIICQVSLLDEIIQSKHSKHAPGVGSFIELCL